MESAVGAKRRRQSGGNLVRARTTNSSSCRRLVSPQRSLGLLRSSSNMVACGLLGEACFYVCCGRYGLISGASVVPFRVSISGAAGIRARGRVACLRCCSSRGAKSCSLRFFVLGNDYPSVPFRRMCDWGRVRNSGSLSLVATQLVALGVRVFAFTNAVAASAIAGGGDFSSFSCRTLFLFT